MQTTHSQRHLHGVPECDDKSKQAAKSEILAAIFVMLLFFRLFKAESFSGWMCLLGMVSSFRWMQIVAVAFDDMPLAGKHH